MTLTAVTPQRANVERFSDILCCATRHLPPRRRAAIGDATKRSEEVQGGIARTARRHRGGDHTDFGNRSRHETALKEVVGVVQGIDYLDRNLRRFMRPTRRQIAQNLRFGLE
jgi:coniferyl-aldehyde dehydrogenase